jgi:hypothetical protein
MFVFLNDGFGPAARDSCVLLELLGLLGLELNASPHDNAASV